MNIKDQIGVVREALKDYAHNTGHGYPAKQALEALTSIEQSTAWQTMESAPRDGTEISIRVRKKNIVTAQWQYHDQDEFDREWYEFKTCGPVHTDLAIFDDEELEWQHLPSPPAKDEGV
jgi:hypothetical protein